MHATGQRTAGGVPIGVLGAGSFGTALAIHLARRGSPTLLWGRDAAATAAMQAARENPRYLPGCAFPAPLEAHADLDHVIARSGNLLIATPSHALRETLQLLAPRLRPDQGLIAACKGLEPGSGLLIHEVVDAVLEERHALAVLSGPTFAKELGLGLPTAVTIASRDQAFAEHTALQMHGDGFRAYWTDDLVGVEIGGAAKNVLAIGVGIIDGMRLGANTRAALITRGMAELMRLAEALGARAETLMGLAGLGDLVLTCTDDQSRNRRMGLLLGQGMTVDQAATQIRQVVEGMRAAPEVTRLARRHEVAMPIVTAVSAVLDGSLTAVEAVHALATRPARPEME